MVTPYLTPLCAQKPRGCLLGQSWPMTQDGYQQVNVEPYHDTLDIFSMIGVHLMTEIGI